MRSRRSFLAPGRTKVILTGDPTQIDNPYLDKDSNALTFTVNKFKHLHFWSYVPGED